jgi:predicted glycogen debranching enzyme
MLPNRFPDHGDRPEFNSVDASLWYVIAVYEYLSALTSVGEASPDGERNALLSAVRSIMEGYLQGTRYRIQVDNDGLLAAGEPGLQLTWMDVKIGDWVVTPRIGKPVELQALWLMLSGLHKTYFPTTDRGRDCWCAAWSHSRQDSGMTSADTCST